ncbi:DUF2612 domain-containing protein [Atlantibacter hermannii]|uniref:DUF2612 domain-containing protein n=1 Tax=Atlantibacter hermannii TaxID=565 RepID=UPI0034D663B0
MKNVKDTILTQYADSPKLRSLIETFNDALDLNEFSEEFLTSMWDISTADTYGLDVWGKIVGISRLLNVEQVTTFFGFDESFTSTENTSPKSFDEAPFFDGPLKTTTYRMSNDAYRILIMAKAMSNITDCSIPNINRLLNYLFGSNGQVFVAITSVMSIRYVFLYEISPVERAIILNSNAITKPSGVSVSLMVIDSQNTFGFAEAGLQPFDNGTFFPDTGIQNANQ